MREVRKLNGIANTISEQGRCKGGPISTDSNNPGIRVNDHDRVRGSLGGVLTGSYSSFLARAPQPSTGPLAPSVAVGVDSQTFS